MKLYNVSEEYITELRKADHKVLLNKNTRPYLGVVLQVGSYEYFVPLSSVKDIKNTNNQLSMKINEYDSNEAFVETLAYIQFLNMIPVKQEYLQEIDISKYYELDNDYYNFVIKEIAFIRKNAVKIKAKAEEVYRNTVNKKIVFIFLIVVTSKN